MGGASAEPLMQKDLGINHSDPAHLLGDPSVLVLSEIRLEPLGMDSPLRADLDGGKLPISQEGIDRTVGDAEPLGDLVDGH